MGSLLHKRIPLPIAMGIIVAVIAVGMWQVTRSSAPGRAAAVGIVYQSVLSEYAMTHGGRLPPSRRDPDFTELASRRRASEAEANEKLSEFERYYDVAWNTQAGDVDANGFTASRQRFLIQPAANSNVGAEMCKHLSRHLAVKMRQAAATQSMPE
jgi:hypothetical protein